MRSGPKVGVLALQGAFREHAQVLDSLGAHPIELRTPSDLGGIDALVLPGGESTTMALLLDRSGLWDELGAALGEGLPTLATCAGLILLASAVAGGRSDQRSYGMIDVQVARNGYGRQVDSFEADIEVTGLEGGPFPAVFIRAPIITSTGPSVDVLARAGDDPVLVSQNAVLAATFHPELSGDLRLHHLFLGGI